MVFYILNLFPGKSFHCGIAAQLPRLLVLDGLLKISNSATVELTNSVMMHNVLPSDELCYKTT